VCDSMKRESSSGGQQLAREIFHSAVSPFRLPFADPLIWPSSPEGCQPSNDARRRDADNGEREREREKERVPQSRERLSVGQLWTIGARRSAIL